MIHAYQDIYLSKAQAVLGDAFDYAINVCGIPGPDFVKLFTVSQVSRRMENGEPSYIMGKSGIETARDIVVETMGMELQIELHEHFERSPEYWIGWAVAYYQWFSGRKFSEIFEAVSFGELQKMYEQRNKNINKASVGTIYCLAKALGCTVEDLIER